MYSYVHRVRRVRTYVRTFERGVETARARRAAADARRAHAAQRAHTARARRARRRRRRARAQRAAGAHWTATATQALQARTHKQAGDSLVRRATINR